MRWKEVEMNVESHTLIFVFTDIFMNVHDIDYRKWHIGYLVYSLVL